MLNLLLYALLVHTPNMLHFPQDLGLRGVNVANALFLIAALAALVFARGVPIRASLRGPLFAYFGALVLAFAIAQVRPAGDVVDDLTYLKTAVFYPIFYFLFLHAVVDQRTARRMLAVALLVAVVAGAEAISEAVSYGMGDYRMTHRAAGPFGQDYRMSNRAGVFYAIFLPLLVAMVLFLRGVGFWRLLAALGSVVIAVGMLFTYSRQSYAIALVAVALLAWRRGVAMTVLLAIASAVAFPFLPSGVTERVEDTQQTTVYGEAEFDQSTESRVHIWAGALAMWAAHPFGVGLNRFKSEIGNYSDFANFDAHNYFVLTLAEGGWIAAFALGWLVIAMLGLALRMRREAVTPYDTALASGVLVAVVCVVLGNLYGSPFTEGSVMGNFWAVLGIAERYFALRRAEAASAGAAEPAPGASAGVGAAAPAR
jgi:O-antigen ligase